MEEGRDASEWCLVPLHTGTVIAYSRKELAFLRIIPHCLALKLCDGDLIVGLGVLALFELMFQQWNERMHN